MIDVSPRVLRFGLLVIVCAASLGGFTRRQPTAKSARQAPTPPSFVVDPSWPKPLPNGWSVGPVSGVAVDRRDHVWIVQRGEAVARAGGRAAPPVIEFAPDGTVVQTWGGPGEGFDWPQQAHGITVDIEDRVWISGNGDQDSHVLAFTRQGKLIRQIGRAGQNGGSNDTANLGRATQMRFDPQHRELFVSDGEMNQNHRVVVFDSDTGAYRRHWGAYGARPDDSAASGRFDPEAPPPRQFGAAVHCLRIDRDGLVYVCDRSNNRFHVFRKDGTFVKEVFVAKETTGTGSVWDIEFSRDQQHVYLADGTNQKMWILSKADDQVVGSFGGPGGEAGRFATSLHDIAVDSSGNLYTGEAATGGRLQKFLLK
ncbi:MAG: hypothetical protein GEU82_04110 [Luteitalea sp.]|nr:hypothetical protein [Luteitalea sp.]